MQDCIATYGDTDILVNKSVICPPGPSSRALEDRRLVFDNLTSMFLTRKHMRFPSMPVGERPGQHRQHRPGRRARQRRGLCPASASKAAFGFSRSVALSTKRHPLERAGCPLWMHRPWCASPCCRWPTVPEAAGGNHGQAGPPTWATWEMMDVLHGSVAGERRTKYRHRNHGRWRVFLPRIG